MELGITIFGPEKYGSIYNIYKIIYLWKSEKVVLEMFILTIMQISKLFIRFFAYGKCVDFE